MNEKRFGCRIRKTKMVHVDTKRLPLLKGQKSTDKREYFFVAIDDFWLRPNFDLIASQSLLFTSYSRELYAAIMPDKTANSVAKFLLEDVIKPCPYLIECVYSDNGTEYKGTLHHPFGVVFKMGLTKNLPNQPTHKPTAKRKG